MSNAKVRHRRRRAGGTKYRRQLFAFFFGHGVKGVSLVYDESWRELSHEQRAESVLRFLTAPCEPFDLDELGDPELWNARHPDRPTTLF